MPPTIRPVQSSPSRRGFLLAAGASAGLLVLGRAGPARAAGRTFHLDPAGSDTDEGTTTRTAWRSLDRLNTAFASGAVVHGDTVLLRRGRMFFGVLRPPAPRDPGAAVLRIGAYGDGDRPVVSAFKVVRDPAAWTPIGDDLWTIDVGHTTHGLTHGGYVSTWTSEIGFLRVGGRIHGDRKTSRAALRDEWQFTSSGSTVTVKCGVNPCVGGRSVQLAVADGLVVANSRTEFSGVAFTGTARNAIQTSSAGPVSDVVVRDCLISGVGGGYVRDTTRFGNGIQVWSGAEAVLAEGNTIEDCYDVAMTVQGPTGASGPWRDVTFADNAVRGCMQTFEAWNTGATAGVAPSCSVTGTVAGLAGASWSALSRPDRVGKGTQLLFYRDDGGARMQIVGNRFLGATQNYCYASTDVGVPSGLDSRGNTIGLAAGGRLQYGAQERLEDHTTWTSRTGLERGSTFVTLPR